MGAPPTFRAPVVLLAQFFIQLLCGVIFLIFYLSGGMGAGDVKLIAAVGCIAGLSNSVYLLVLTALANGVMGIGMALMRGRLRETLFNVAALAKAAPGELSAGVGDIGQYLKRQQEGSFVWLEEMFETSSIAHKFKMLILQADSHTSVGTVMMTMFGLGFATLCLTYLLTGMLAVAVIAALMLSYAPVGVLRFLRVGVLQRLMRRCRSASI